MTLFLDCALSSARRLAATGLVVLGLLSLAGCGRSGPRAYPLQGKVVSEKGANLQKLVGSSVELESATEPLTRGFGIIQADGSFTISTYRQGETFPGAVEGKHRARIMLDMGEDDDGPPRKKKWPIDAKYTRFETSGWEVTVPASGDVLFKLP